jgi:hypothetical protein
MKMRDLINIIESERIDELSTALVQKAQGMRHQKLVQASDAGKARTVNGYKPGDQPTRQSIDTYHDSENAAIDNDHQAEYKRSGKYDADAVASQQANNERERGRNMQRGKMINVANRKMNGTSNVATTNEEVLEESAGTRTITNPNPRQWASLVDGDMVRCLILMDGKNTIIAWKAGDALHSDVMGEISNTNCIPLRVIGQPNGVAKIEITETIRKTDLADKKASELIAMVKAIPFFASVYSQVNVVDFMTEQGMRQPEPVAEKPSLWSRMWR